MVEKEYMMGKIILASSSPRRAEILKSKYDFEIVPSPYVENHSTTAFSYDYVQGLAYNKAKAVIPLVDKDYSIIGADTVVVLEGEILEKPKDINDAKRMLRELSGKTHQVVTAIALVDTKTGRTEINSTTSNVTFNDLTDEMINFYVNNFKPLDKAGAYGIQELPDGFVKEFSGSLENIIGICPVALENLFKRFTV